MQLLPLAVAVNDMRTNKVWTDGRSSRSNRIRQHDYESGTESNTSRFVNIGVCNCMYIGIDGRRVATSAVLYQQVLCCGFSVASDGLFPRNWIRSI